MQRTIIHIDMDAFFAAVEQRDNPSLIGKPVIIGGVSGRGVVSTASYEARKFGVHSAMPMSEARKRCPNGIFMPSNHNKYEQVSQQLREIFAEYSPLVEPLSLDEAFLDVSGMTLLYPDAKAIAVEIKARIHTELGLTASAGVAPNKFLAKLASDIGKPNGLVVINPGGEEDFLKELPVTRLWGIGEMSAALLNKAGFKTIGQIAKAEIAVLQKFLGNAAQELKGLAKGMDDRPVIPEHEPKSVGSEITFEYDLQEWDELEEQLLALAEKVGRRLRKKGLRGRTITLKLRYTSFKTISRSKTLPEPFDQDDVIYDTVRQMLRWVNLEEPVRLLGVTVAKLNNNDGQLSLFQAEEEKKIYLTKAVDKIKDRFGEGAITRGRLI